MSTLSRDMRHAVRTLYRAPGFTVTAVFTLALAIGANTAVFSVVDRVLLRPLPYPDSDRLVVVMHPVPGYTSTEWGLSRAGYFYFKQNSQALQDLGVYRSPSVVLTGGDRAERIDAALITASVLTTLQVSPVVGRPFNSEDDAPGAEPVVLLGYDLWARRFGGDESIIGRTILVDGSAEEVIGVMPPGFHFPQPSTDLWRPMRLNPNARAINQHIFPAIGRVKAGVDLDATLLELRSLVQRFPEVFPTAYSTRFLEESQFDVTARFMLDDTVQNVSQALWIVLGTVGLVLLMACANVANLNLVRAEGRRREVALRTALGADRTHLLGQYLSESFVLAAIGGVLGVGLAYLGVDLMTAFAPTGLPRMQEIGLDGRAVTVAGALTVISALFFGTFPLLRHGEVSMTQALKEGARSATPSKQRQRIRNGLVVSQVAIALVLLAASGLLFRTYLALRTVDLGFETENVFTARLSVVRAKYEDNAAVLRFWETARERLAALPMVTSAGMTLQLEIADRAYDNATEITDLPEGGTETQLIDEKFASIGYFETMGMRLVEGRFMDRTDQDMRAPGAIITRSMAEEYWPGQSALGKRVRPLFRELPWHTVVGVIEDVRTEGIRKAPEPTVYFPYTSLRIPSMAFVIRTAAPASAILSAIQREIWSLDPDVPIAEAVTMERIVADDMARTTFTLSLLGLAAGMALLLGAVGIYGVISYTVSRRAPEIGIRLALGARGGQVGGMVLSQTLRLALLGIAIGMGAALAVNRVIASVLFGVQSTDPLTLVVVCFVLVMVAALAGYLPARRASRVDPLEALRVE